MSDDIVNNKQRNSDLSLRAEAVRQSHASLALEGFKLDPEVIELDRRYVSGELTLEEKMVLIKKLYGVK